MKKIPSNGMRQLLDGFSIKEQGGDLEGLLSHVAARNVGGQEINSLNKPEIILVYTDDSAIALQ